MICVEGVLVVLDITEVISLLQVIYGLNAFARKYSGVIT
jgi:hypothetical protein